MNGFDLAKAGLKRLTVSTPAGDVVVRELTVAQRGMYVQEVRDAPSTIAAWLVYAGLAEPALSREDIEGISPPIVEQIALGVLEVSGFGTKGKD